MEKATQRFDPRQTMNSQTYEVFHYLDMKTRHLEAHFHDFYELFYFLDGDTDYWIDGRIYHLQTGDLLLIGPSELHKPAPRSENDRYERIVLWLDPSYFSSLGTGALRNCFLQEGSSPRKLLRPHAQEKKLLQNLFFSLAKESNGNEFEKDTYALGILLQTLVLINRIALRPQEPLEKESAPTLIAKILSYISAHFEEDLSLERLSSHFFINKYYLAHEFKKAVGTSVHRYLILKRLSEAYRLLAEGRAPGEVAALCGFGDYTAFYRAFKAEYGMAPSSFT